jgi:hypothetical protein
LREPRRPDVLERFLADDPEDFHRLVRDLGARALRFSWTEAGESIWGGG